jgi:hypothetical protein
MNAAKQLFLMNSSDGKVARPFGFPNESRQTRSENRTGLQAGRQSPTET